MPNQKGFVLLHSQTVEIWFAERKRFFAVYSAIQSLNNAPKDTSVEIYNPANTYLLTGGISVLAGILLYAIIL